LRATISATALKVPVPMPTATALVVVTDQIAMVAVAAEGVAAGDAVVAVEVKAGIARARRRGELWAPDLRALARRLPGQRTHLPRKLHRFRRVTVRITTRTLVTRHRNPSSGRPQHRRLRHNM
jgi:hypothetical protein